MSGAVCPYCRTPIVTEEESIACSGCSTPHHRECWEENGGCTVFGCAEAPVEEAKVVVSGGDLGQMGGGYPGGFAADTTGVPPPPARLGETGGESSTFSPSGSAAHSMLGLSEPPAPAFSLSGIDATPSTDRRTYTLLGFFFGYLGVHNLYAKRMSVGIIQLCVTVLTCFVAAPILWIWALVEIYRVDQDGDGHRML